MKTNTMNMIIATTLAIILAITRPWAWKPEKPGGGPLTNYSKHTRI